MKKPWAFIRVPYMNPTVFGVIGPGFLNQVPTSGQVCRVWWVWFGVSGSSPGFSVT